MSVKSSAFQRCEPRQWHGRYARIPGDYSVFHLTHVAGRLWPVVYWDTEDGTGTCAACQCDTAEQLADGVSRAKRKAGGSGGGSFVINEYGQVLVPASDGSGRRFLAGHLQGRLLFENPFKESESIDLGDCRHIQPGGPWKLPYVGFPFNLNRRSMIYYYHEGEEGGQSVYPRQQDIALVQSLRRIRRTGPVRFIVNPWGVVLTKRPVQDDWSPEESWKPFYVGKINIKMWFEKEDGRA
jgi:hypothetical protein